MGHSVVTEISRKFNNALSLACAYLWRLLYNISQPVTGDIATFALTIKGTVQNKVWVFCILLTNSAKVKLLLLFYPFISHRLQFLLK